MTMNPIGPVSIMRQVANCYVFQLHLLRHACPHRNTSCSLARTVHAHMIASGFVPHGHIRNRLMDIYCKSSRLGYAHRLFDEIPHQDVVARTTLISAYSYSGDLDLAKEVFVNTPVGIRDPAFYNAMITAYSHNHDGHAAVALFLDMGRCSFRADENTFMCVLGALGMVMHNERDCCQLHCAVVKSGAGRATSVSNALLSAYLKCVSPECRDELPVLNVARSLFEEMLERDEITWTTMITGYLRNDAIHKAREIFDGMGEKLAAAWNAMISGYVHKGLYTEALEMFRKMCLSGTELDEYAITSIISACSNAGFFELGKQVHAYMLRAVSNASPESLLPMNNALITLYWKSGKNKDARTIFEKMPLRDPISWNAILSGYINDGRILEAKSFFEEIPKKNLLTWTVMISGLAQNGYGEDGLKLFSQMKSNGIGPCDYSFAGAITSCAVLGSLENGCQLHGQLIRLGFESSLSVGNAMITMYARCGVVEAAGLLFDTMPFLDSVSWNAMVAALGQHGRGAEALELFDEMLREGILPDRISFLTILSACSYAGLVKEGRHYFDMMHKSYGMTPGEDHYARLIDLLCRAGKFSEAMELIESIPFKPSAPVWEALLAGSRIHGNMDLGAMAAEKLFNLIPQHDGTYVVLSNMYADAGRWDEMANVRKLMRDQGVKKEPGCSWLEVESQVHVFRVNDAVHPEVHAIYDYLEHLDLEIRKLGYVPNTKLTSRGMESGQKDPHLSTHSEKLAVAFGLMRLPLGATIRIFKNLRICSDCHNAFKYISIVAGREIVVRDGKRFHHFRNGGCSCGDYW